MTADASPTTPAPARALTPARTRWWGFALFALASVIHVAALTAGTETVAGPTKLLLMPVLAFAAIWAARDLPRRPGMGLLVAAIAASWLGDGAATFFPFAPTLPTMLLCFGAAHIAYMALFALRMRRPVPPWASVYALWWTAMIAVLWPHLGSLQLAVAFYGLVLGGTAVLAARGGAITAVGGAFFLASDTILALRLFLPDDVTGPLGGPWVMLTYTIGQCLLAYGIVRRLRAGAAIA
ncbi:MULTISPECIES: lysoplasmalogenase family protein [unclassified Microbacterium]|uniref:lysoplasmalogenase n=1 Tax=unclassified Microbacterium TaxID=2609290 RepID=UPI000A8D95A9|nr:MULTISPECIES: lysoplasmalogenase family protein [unclassified Microbacterium]